MDKFEITKERIVKAANVCPDAQRVLKELFPEAFKCEKEWVDCTEDFEPRLHWCGYCQGWDIRFHRKSDGREIGKTGLDGTIDVFCDEYRIRKYTGLGTHPVFIIQRKEATSEKA